MKGTMKIPYVVDSYFITLQGELYFAMDINTDDFKEKIKKFSEELNCCEEANSFESKPVMIADGQKEHDHMSFHLDVQDKKDAEGYPYIHAYVNDNNAVPFDNPFQDYPLLTWKEAKKWCEDVLALEG